MAAFSSVVALEQLLNQLSNSDKLPKEDLVPLLEKVSSLKSSLENIFPAPKDKREDANKLAIKIREEIFKAQDQIETYIFTQSNPSDTAESSKSQSSTSISLKEITENIDPIIHVAEELGDEVKKAPGYSQPVDKTQTYNSSVFNQKNKIIGQDEYNRLIKEKLLAETGSRLVIPICGMPGIGKTTLAKSIYEDLAFMKNFPYKAWVTVSQDANVHDILGKILATLESRAQKAGTKTYEGDEAKLKVELHQALSNNKYLVVVDDMWDTDFWMKLQLALPDNENKSRILLTTRILNVGKFVNPEFSLEMEPLNDEDSWTLLRNKTFGDDAWFPPELESNGRGIAKHCKGLPLSLTVIGGLLSQGIKETEYWQVIEEDTYAATADAKVEEAYLGILSLSYDHLPAKLKGCFLYMGAFPEDSDIPVSKIIKLWVAEGFLTPRFRRQLVDEMEKLALEETKPPPPQPILIEETAKQSLDDLIDRNLVMIRKNRSNGKIRSCGVHDSLRDLAENESGRDRFFHLRKRYAQKLDEEVKNIQRRVSVHKNILMCLEDVYNTTKEIISPRSLLYVGPHHHHPMPFTLSYDLLRVLDAYTVYFIRFPEEFLKLVHLRYLSFTYNGKLPTKVCELEKLQVLIVKRKPKIIFVGMPFLPDEIWGMKELRHLLMTETDLPILPPTEPGTILFENLQTLFNVNAESCGDKVLDHMPNLTRLGMWREGPKKVEYNMKKLDKLEIFKFTVLNPILVPPPEVQPKFHFPNTVRKLNLSGTGIPWEDMEAIATLPNLEVLKLKELALHGSDWCPNYIMKKLQYLQIEYLNLQRWEADISKYPVLEQLILRHCYDLEVLPSEFAGGEKLRFIEMVDCSPEAVKWASEIEEMVEDYGYKNPLVRIYCSWE